MSLNNFCVYFILHGRVGLERSSKIRCNKKGEREKLCVNFSMLRRPGIVCHDGSLNTTLNILKCSRNFSRGEKDQFN